MATKRKLPHLNKKIATARTPQTENYKTGASAFVRFHYGERPQWSLWQANDMLLDPQVTVALAVRNGLLSLAKCKVDYAPPRIKEFVEHTWESIWQVSSRQIFAAKNYGWGGYEVMYRRGSGRYSGMVMFDRLRDFRPQDVRPLVKNGQLVGMSVRRIDHKGEHTQEDPLWITGAKKLWLTYAARYGSWFGESLLEHAYAPWYEKWMRGGGISLRKLRMFKDAWRGDFFRYPNEIIKDQEGNELSARDVGRELGESLLSGGVMGLPSEVHPNTNVQKWDYQPPTNVSGTSQIHEYIDNLDLEILDGLQVMKEVMEASESGSGFSGRSIPFLTLMAVLQVEGNELTRQLREQIIDPLVELNFNAPADYELSMAPLMETVGAAMGGGGGQENKPPPQVAGHGGPEMAGGMFQKERPPVQFSAHPSALRSPGCTVGGVYYRPGEWVDGEALQWASEQELQVLQFADSGKGEWITIGGHPKGDAQHSGGVPVKMHRGQIVSGPKSLTGRNLNEIADKRRPDSKVVEAIRKGASEWKVNKRELREAVEYVHSMKHSALQEREKAKVAVRKMTGLTAGDVARLENAGKDYTAIKGFDEVAREIAGQFPELGLGGGYEGGANYDDTDYASAVWDLLREGKVAGPAKHDSSLVDEAANLVLENRKRQRLEGKREADAVPFSDA